MVAQRHRIAGTTGITKLCTQGKFIQWVELELNKTSQLALLSGCSRDPSRSHSHDPATPGFWHSQVHCLR